MQKGELERTHLVWAIPDYGKCTPTNKLNFFVSGFPFLGCFLSRTLVHHRAHGLCLWQKWHQAPTRHWSKWLIFSSMYTYSYSMPQAKQDSKDGCLPNILPLSHRHYTITALPTIIRFRCDDSWQQYNCLNFTTAATNTTILIKTNSINNIVVLIQCCCFWYCCRYSSSLWCFGRQGKLIIVFFIHESYLLTRLVNASKVY